MQALKQRIRHVPDFPKPGILFYDVTTLLKDREGFRMAVDAMAAPHLADSIDLVVGIESRGFIFGSAVADRLAAGFAPVRKPGKLPSTIRRASYALEYGENSLELHADAIASGQRVLVHDDVLATGGTAKAICDLAEQLGGEIVGVVFAIELDFLEGRKQLEGHDVHSLIHY